MATFSKTSTSEFTGSVTTTTQKITFNIPTKGTYLDRNITLTISARTGAISLAGGGLQVGTGTVTGTNITTSTTNSSGVIIYGSSGTITRAAITYSTTTSGWINASAGTSTNITSTSTTPTKVTNYLTGVTLSAPASGENTLTLTDAIGTWTWKSDSNGNVYIY